MNADFPGAPIPIKYALVPAGHPNRPGTKLDGGKPDAIVVHGTGNTKPGAGDETHGLYVARKYDRGLYLDRSGVKHAGALEVGTKGVDGVGTQFVYGCAHAYVDLDSITITIPEDEVTWHCGDRQRPWDKLNRGQTTLARIRFGNGQNHRTLGVELCMNRDWAAVCANGRWLIAFWLKKYGLTSNDVLRHKDLTGKACPAWLTDIGAWTAFVREFREDM